jgi:hypothetical protein
VSGAFFGCSGDAEYKAVDFAKAVPIVQPETKDASRDVLRVAVAAMISPGETFVYYQELLDYIGKNSGFRVQLIQRKTYEEVNKLFPKGQIDLAFICTGPFAASKDKFGFEALATPQVRRQIAAHPGRVNYFGPVMSIYCLLMAVLSGTALFILYSLVVGRVTGTDSSGESGAVLYDEFTLVLTYAAGIVTAFTLLKIIIESSTTIPAFLVYHKFEHLFGSIGVFGTEVILGLFLPFVLLLIPSVRGSIGGRLLASTLIFVGSLARHMEILLAGQSHPVGPKAEQFPQYVQYVPSIWELLVLVFALAVMLLLYTLGERYLKLNEAPTG